LDTIVRDTQPDWVLVQGDTTTVMAAGLLAYYHHVRVGHVEAGLRTGDKWQPFPEEVNRKVTGVVADLHFAPTEQSRDNLLHEGVNAESIVITGNPVIDALNEIAERPYDFDHPVFQAIPEGRRLILVTAHRRENFGEPMERIFEALREIAERYREDVHLVYPVHPADDPSYEKCLPGAHGFRRAPRGGAGTGHAGARPAPGDGTPRGCPGRDCTPGWI